MVLACFSETNFPWHLFDSHFEPRCVTRDVSFKQILACFHLLFEDRCHMGQSNGFSDSRASEFQPICDRPPCGKPFVVAFHAHVREFQRRNDKSTITMTKRAIHKEFGFIRCWSRVLPCLCRSCSSRKDHCWTCDVQTHVNACIFERMFQIVRETHQISNMSCVSFMPSSNELVDVIFPAKVGHLDLDHLRAPFVFCSRINVFPISMFEECLTEALNLPLVVLTLVIHWPVPQHRAPLKSTRTIPMISPLWISNFE